MSERPLMPYGSNPIRGITPAETATIGDYPIPIDTG